MRGNLVMTCFSGNTEKVKLLFDLLHEFENPVWNRAEVVIFKLLPFRRHCTKKSPSAHDKVRTHRIEFAVHKEVLLLSACIGIDTADVFDTENTEKPGSRFTDRVHRAKKRSLFIKCFSMVGNKHCRNTKGIAFAAFHEKGRTGRIPCGIASGFKGRSHPAGRKTRSIGFTLNKLLAGKTLDSSTVPVDREKSIVFFSSGTGHRLEPVRVMGRTVFHCPIFHTVSDSPCDLLRELVAGFYSFLKCLIHLFRQFLQHCLLIEGQSAKIR